MYAIYSLALTLGVALTAPYWLFRALREKKYFPSLSRRLGFHLPEWDHSESPVWIHAVSVGEVLAAKPLVAALLARHPGISLIASTVTLTGQKLAQRELPSAARHLFFPLDWQFAVRRFLNRFHPRAVVIMETELWPNFIRECHRRGIPVCLANGRISDRSTRRYRLARSFFRDVLSRLEVICAQTAEDRGRFVALGAREANVYHTGNLKFDFPTATDNRHAALLQSIRSALLGDGEGPVLVVGSSMRGEEPIFLEAYRLVSQSIPGLRLILAPRHPERFDEVERLVSSSGAPYQRRSGLREGGPNARILILDTIGELRFVYSLADVAVIGGSFEPFGGHNLLEPAALGKAIVFGPHMFNFREMAHLFLRERAARQAGPDSLPSLLLELLSNPDECNRLGRRALSILLRNQGAADRTVSLLSPCLE